MKIKMSTIFRAGLIDNFGEDGKPSSPIARLSSQALSIKVSAIIKRNQRLLAPEIEQMNNTRNDLIKELGEEITPGNFKLKKENIVEFTKQMTEAGDIECELDVHSIKMSEFEGVISADDLEILKFMFAMDEEEGNE